MPHTTENVGDDRHPERRSDAEQVREIVRMTVHEVFDTLSIDISTPAGRQRFRDNMAFLDDARSGTGTAKKTLLGVVLTGFLYGVWKLIAAGLLAMGVRP